MIQYFVVVIYSLSATTNYEYFLTLNFDYRIHVAILINNFGETFFFGVKSVFPSDSYFHIPKDDSFIGVLLPWVRTSNDHGNCINLL